MSAFDDMVNELEHRGFSRAVAEAEVRAQYPEYALAAIAKSELDEAAREREVESDGDRVMLALGFAVVRLSQSRPSKVCAGLPDRRYYRPPRVVDRDNVGWFCPAITLWWEAKAEWGAQRPDQRAFQEMVEACGETYVLGTHRDLLAWLETQGIARVEADGTITSLHVPLRSSTNPHP